MNDVKLLFLDDDKDRIQFIIDMVGDFNELFHDTPVTLYFAKDFESFKERCLDIHVGACSHFDVVCFDHDLADFQEDCIEWTVEDCAAWYVDFLAGYHTKPYIFVHSWNPTGAKNISNCFNNAEDSYRGQRIAFGRELVSEVWNKLMDLAKVSDRKSYFHVPDSDIYLHSLEEM
jgi:hypothetical protein